MPWPSWMTPCTSAAPAPQVCPARAGGWNTLCLLPPGQIMLHLSSPMPFFPSCLGWLGSDFQDEFLALISALFCSDFRAVPQAGIHFHSVMPCGVSTAADTHQAVLRPCHAIPCRLPAEPGAGGAGVHGCPGEGARAVRGLHGRYLGLGTATAPSLLLFPCTQQPQQLWGHGQAAMPWGQRDTGGTGGFLQAGGVNPNNSLILECLQG